MSAMQAAASALDALQQSAGSAADRLLEASQIEHVWNVVQGRISAHFIDHYQERVKEKCGSRPSSQVAPEPTAATAPVAGPDPRPRKRAKPRNPQPDPGGPSGPESIDRLIARELSHLRRNERPFMKTPGHREARPVLPGQDYDLERRQGHAGARALRLEAAHDARGLRGDDGQRQDGAVPVAAGRGGDRRHPGRSRSTPRGTSATCCSAFPSCAARISRPGSIPTRRPARGSPASSTPTRRPRPGKRGSPPGGKTGRGSSGFATPSTWRSTRPDRTPGCR